MLLRELKLPPRPAASFFLWGPRQTGKSTLLRTLYPDAIWLDLLKSDEFVRYTEAPWLLRQELEARPKEKLVVVDEIQKVPSLLEEIHWLMENRGRVFVMCGSSARKVRRSGTNLLGGRAVRYELYGLTSREIGPEFDLTRMLNHGYLPRHYLAASPRRLLRAYVDDYLKEEIAHEGLTRKLPAFASFLGVAALSDTELVNYATISRECGVSAPTVREYFQILVDTLLGRFLPAYTKRPKRRVIGAPKFYFADVGVVNVLSKRGLLEPGSELFGKAFENWVFHELTAYSQYREKLVDFAYWRLASGIEVDFLSADRKLAVEVTASARVTTDRLRGLRELAVDQPGIGRRCVVCMEPKPRVTEDRIEILPWRVFCDRLWNEQLI